MLLEIKELYILNDQKLRKEQEENTQENDPQILKDAVAAIKIMFESFATHPVVEQGMRTVN